MAYLSAASATALIVVSSGIMRWKVLLALLSATLSDIQEDVELFPVCSQTNSFSSKAAGTDALSPCLRLMR